MTEEEWEMETELSEAGKAFFKWEKENYKKLDWDEGRKFAFGCFEAGWWKGRSDAKH